MVGLDEGKPYSTIFTSLKHPVRRKILRMLSEKPRNFSEILEVLGISSSHLTYHLENLGELTFKTEEGKYKLSKLGEATVETMSRVEETPKPCAEPKRPPSLPINWKSFFLMLMIGLLILSGESYSRYNSLKTFLNALSAEHEGLEALVELVEKGASLQHNYNLTYKCDKVDSGFGIQGRWWCSAYIPYDNFTLHLVFSISTILSESQVFTSIQEGNVFDLEPDETAPVVWSANATVNRIYSVPFASKGWYTISLVGPIRKLLCESEMVIGYGFGPAPDASEHVDCWMALRVIHEGVYSLSFVTHEELW